MKYILSFIIIQVLFSNCCLSNKPFSFTDSLNQLKSIELIDDFVTEIPDIEPLITYIDSLDDLGINHPHYYGIGIDSELNIDDVGSWDTLNNGDRVWRFKIICPNAFTINIDFEKFQLAENSNISFYNVNHTSLLGPYYNDINRIDSLFSSHLINSDTIVLELFEPLSDQDKNALVINKIVYGCSDNNDKVSLFKEAKIQASDHCLVDANCEEGDEYCKEKYSVARIISKTSGVYYYLGTGTLINNTAQDYKPYLLTAYHNIDLNFSNILSQSEKDKTQIWNIQFGYIRENCGSGSSLVTYEYFGADFRAAWDLDHSEFALVELKIQPKSGENNFPDVFFSGWDRTGNIPNNVGSLHYPTLLTDDEESYYMKVNLDSDQPTTYNTYWWSVDNWDIGSTGPGSSGSPLYNEDRRIVGQLTGQQDWTLPGSDPNEGMCDPNKEAIYGKFSLSWDGGGTSDTRLKDWLDPGNTGVTTLDGIKMPNLQYGKEIANGITETYNAYSNMHIGSSTTDSYRVQSGGDLTLKAGREIKISGCTQIKAGSEFHTYIEEPDCDDEVLLSDKLTDHDPSVCSAYPKQVKENQEFDSPFTRNTTLTISPNPVTSISDISLTVGRADNVSLVLYDNLGNQRLSYLDNISFKSGTYNYKLDGNELNSGMFVLLLKIDGKIVTEKIINLK